MCPSVFFAVARFTGAATIGERICSALSERNNMIVGGPEFGGKWSFAPVAVF